MPYKVYQAQPLKQPEIETKVEPETAAAEMAEPSCGTNGTTADSNGTEKGKNLPVWLKLKEAGGIKKIPKVVQKRRWNFRLKKMLAPKSPTMLLYEIVNAKDVVFTTFDFDKMVKIEATYDGKTFQGIGPNKTIAKNVCAEQILQHFVFKSCQKQSKEGDKGEMTAEGDSVGKNEELIPWTAIASLGLFKLFNDWQAQGVQLPAELLLGQAGKRPLAPTPFSGAEDALMEDAPPVVKREKKSREPKEAKPKELPENAQLRHPVQLLNEMCGQLDYETTQEDGPPNYTYRTVVTVNGVQFSGVSRNKKESKKFAAQAAMTSVYNVVYPVD